LGFYVHGRYTLSFLSDRVGGLGNRRSSGKSRSRDSDGENRR